MIAVDTGPSASAIANHADVEQAGHMMMGGVIQLVDMLLIHSIMLPCRLPANAIACWAMRD